MIDFREFPKIPRFSRNCVITEASGYLFKKTLEKDEQPKGVSGA